MLRTFRTNSGSFGSLAAAMLAVCRAETAVARAVQLEPLRERGAVLASPVIPPAFRGHWSVDLDNCSDPPTDDSQVWIAAGSLDSYETNGHVVRVVVQDDRRAVIVLMSEGEGISFTAKKGLTLSSGRHYLIIRDEDDTGHGVYRRCPVRRRRG